MSGPVPDRFWLYALLAGFGLALLVVVLGVVLVARRGLTLRKRIEQLKDLPFLPTLELTQARVALASRRADTVPALLERARVANAQLIDARTSLSDSANAVRTTVRAMFGKYD